MNRAPATASRTAGIVGAAFLAVYGALTAVSLSGAGLWRDEIATRIFSALSPTQLWRATGHVDSVLRGYYLFIHYWRVFGDGPVALRFPSWIAGGAIVLLIVRAAATAWGTAAGVIAGAYLLLNAQFLYWATTARSYALVMLLMVAATLQVDSRTARKTSRGRVLTYLLATSAAVLLQPLAVLVVLAQLVVVLVTRASRDDSRIAAVTVVPIAAAGLLLVASRSQQRQAELARGGSVRGALRVMNTLVGGTGVGALVLVAVGVSALVQVRRRCLDRLWLMGLALLAIPMAGLFVLSRMTGLELLERYNLMATGAFALVLGGGTALGLSAVSGTTRWVSVVLVIGLVASISYPRAHAMVTGRVRTDDYASAVAYLRTHAHRGDLILLNQTYRSGGFAAGFAYYARDGAFSSFVERALTSGGEPDVYARTVLRPAPLTTAAYRSAAGPAGRVWYATFLPRPSRTHLPSPVTSVCPRARADVSSRFGDITLLGISCSPAGR
ncbi:MAG TPA: hypothetical protein VGN18_14535 [Jatrophihabitans sp.]|jgi:mannosyltransferase|uniref:hypothetical protein n=1 Tax=Jatrophihabitans sp. TaxID=1932789 RepID=UPI002E0884C4|nr:hypothetical protein [Jatrophihabitans sp.]